MTDRENERLVRSLVADVLNDKRYDAVTTCCHEDVVMHRPGDLDEVGQDAYIEHYRHLHRTFPDFQATIKDVLADDDRIGLRLALTGTHEDELLGRAPTGTSVAFSAQIIYRLSNGRIVEEWHESDRLGLLRQLGEW
jgi:predicted ester cyclase